MNAVGDQSEYDVVEARIRTRDLIEQTEPVLHDLEAALEKARNMLSRLEEVVEEDDDDPQHAPAPGSGGAPHV